MVSLTEADDKLQNLQNDLAELTHVQETTQLGYVLEIDVGFGCEGEVFEAVEVNDCHIDMVASQGGDVKIWAKVNQSPD